MTTNQTQRDRDCHPDYWNSDGHCLICGLTHDKCELAAELATRLSMRRYLRLQREGADLTSAREAMSRALMRWLPLAQANLKDDDDD